MAQKALARASWLERAAVSRSVSTITAPAAI